MLADHLRFLICPHCHGELTYEDRTLRCERGHTFDVARQGYVSLLGGKGRTVPGDTEAMVSARADFLAAGHFEPIATEVTRTAKAELARQASSERCVADLGAGTGYYLNHLATRIAGSYDPVALDVSKAAIRHAARSYPRLAAVVADIRHHVPVRSGCAGLVLSTFAPREVCEVDRVLAPDGAVLAVIPDELHLIELVRRFDLLSVEDHKRNRLDDKLSPAFVGVSETSISRTLQLTADDIGNLISMGPSAWHRSDRQTEPLLASLPDRLSVTASVHVLTYRRR